MGAACCRPSAADDSYDAGGAIKEKQGSNGGLSGARRGKRERDGEMETRSDCLFVFVALDFFFLALLARAALYLGSSSGKTSTSPVPPTVGCGAGGMGTDPSHWASSGTVQ